LGLLSGRSQPQNRTIEAWEYIWYPYVGSLMVLFGLFYFVYPPQE
jgi:hypothetical protein